MPETDGAGSCANSDGPLTPNRSTEDRIEAGNNGPARAACVGYTECDWGDLIEGTKEQLQALELGIGLAFPGEVGGPQIELKVRDSRGYPVRVSN